MEREHKNVRKLVLMSVPPSYKKLLHLNSFRSSSKALSRHAMELNLPSNTKRETLNNFT